MTINSNTNDKAIGSVGKTLRTSIVEGLGDLGMLIRAIDELNQVDTIEELSEALDDVLFYDEVPSLEELLEGEGATSLEEMVELEKMGNTCRK